jgi:CheY-like chemotaxis protein
VAWNLLSNAIKFTPARGRVKVALGSVGSHVELAVSDTGQGFHPGFQPHLFERFRQADSSSGRQYGGLGLGLAIVRHLVELHGGTVAAESPGEGHGATFTVRLPVRVSEGNARALEHRGGIADAGLEGGAFPTLHGVRLLVVDDEQDSTDVVTTLLESCGADVRAAAATSQALDLMRTWTPDLLVSDIGMPGEDGFALRAAMRRDPKLLGIPAIALTAYATHDDHVRILAAGFQMHVAKPIDPLELVTSVASLVKILGKL